MAKFNWDKVRMDNLVERKGTEYIRSEAERYTGLHHDTKRDVKDGPRYCPHCDDPVTLEGLRAHILKYHTRIKTYERRPTVKIRKQANARELITCPQCGVSVRRLQKHINKVHGEGTKKPRKEKPAQKPKAPPPQKPIASPQRERAVATSTYSINLFYVQGTKKRAVLAEEILNQQGATVMLKQVKDDALSAKLGGKVYYFQRTKGDLAGARVIVHLLKSMCRLSIGEVSFDSPSPVPYSIWLTK